MTREGKVSLLIADDDPHLRLFIEAAAERSGCFGVITTVSDGEAALQLVRHAAPGHAPDMIVSDLSMPRMTGIDLIRALKADPATRTIPVAIITSSDLPNDREEALAAGACAFESKPMRIDDLTALLRTLRHHCCEAEIAQS
jgi:CheY-like chemotaxis protein